MRKRNISPERLIEAIKEYIDRKGSFDTIAEKYCIAYETIRNAYHSLLHTKDLPKAVSTQNIMLQETMSPKKASP